MLNCRPSFECWAAFPHSCKHGWGQSSHHSLSAMQPIATKVLQCSSNVPSSFGVYQPYGLWVLLRCAFKAQLPNPLRVLSKTQPRCNRMDILTVSKTEGWLWYGLKARSMRCFFSQKYAALRLLQKYSKITRICKQYIFGADATLRLGIARYMSKT